jgi:hypothetical protein
MSYLQRFHSFIFHQQFWNLVVPNTVSSKLIKTKMIQYPLNNYQQQFSSTHLWLNTSG